VAQVPLGSAGDLPVTGDWDGDGVTDLGVWTPATAAFTQRVPLATAGLRSATADVTADATATELRTVFFGRPR
jgi:hypothetical protein